MQSVKGFSNQMLLYITSYITQIKSKDIVKQIRINFRPVIAIEYKTHTILQIIFQKIYYCYGNII